MSKVPAQWQILPNLQDCMRWMRQFQAVLAARRLAS